MNYVQSAGLSVEKQGFFFESKDEPLTVIVLAVRSEDKDNETYKKLQIFTNLMLLNNTSTKHSKALLQLPTNKVYIVTI